MTARIAAFVHDIVVAGIAFLLAYFLRFNFNVPPNVNAVLAYTFLFSGVSAAAFLALGVQRGVWRYSSISDLRKIVIASTVSMLAFLLGLFLFNRLAFVPRSVPVMTWFVMVVLLSAPRVTYRVVKAWQVGQSSTERVRLLVAGTSAEADELIRRFRLESNGIYEVAGIVSFENNLSGRRLRGAEILGPVSQLAGVLDRLQRHNRKPDAIVLVRPRAHHAESKTISEMGAAAGIPVTRMVEPAASIIDGPAQPKLNPLTLDDLLGRPPVGLDIESIRGLLEGRTVMITGAGGSIGSEISRQVSSYGPRRLIILDSSELALYTIDQEIDQAHPSLERCNMIESICDREAVFRLIAEIQPDIIFHAAALKHVPLLEANACSAVRTNTIGTRNVADAAVATGVRAMVMISTDKAIRPSSVMGASKRAAESYCQALDVSGAGTRFVTVRFGNVLGSNGSVVPLFQRQILAGGPVTVTHPDMKRYFMSIGEAAELVLHAAAHGLTRPSERGTILVLDMGEPIRIVDLARTMITMAGHTPDVDIPVVFTGIRTGEKLFEELFDPNETNDLAAVDGLFVATPRVTALSRLVPQFEALERAANAGDTDGTLWILREIVPEYGVTSDSSAASINPSPRPTMRAR